MKLHKLNSRRVNGDSLDMLNLDYNRFYTLDKEGVNQALDYLGLSGELVNRFKSNLGDKTKIIILDISDIEDNVEDLFNGSQEDISRFHDEFTGERKDAIEGGLITYKWDHYMLFYLQESISRYQPDPKYYLYLMFNPEDKVFENRIDEVFSKKGLRIFNSNSMKYGSNSRQNNSVKIPQSTHPDGTSSSSYIIVDEMSPYAKVLKVFEDPSEPRLHGKFKVGEVFNAELFVDEIGYHYIRDENSACWYVIKEPEGFVSCAPLPGDGLSKGSRVYLGEANNGKGGMVSVVSGPYSSYEEASSRVPNSRFNKLNSRKINGKLYKENEVKWSPDGYPNQSLPALVLKSSAKNKYAKMLHRCVSEMDSDEFDWDSNPISEFYKDILGYIDMSKIDKAYDEGKLKEDFPFQVIKTIGEYDGDDFSDALRTFDIDGYVFYSFVAFEDEVNNFNKLHPELAVKVEKLPSNIKLNSRQSNSDKNEYSEFMDALSYVDSYYKDLATQSQPNPELSIIAIFTDKFLLQDVNNHKNLYIGDRYMGRELDKIRPFYGNIEDLIIGGINDDTLLGVNLDIASDTLKDFNRISKLLDEEFNKSEFRSAVGNANFVMVGIRDFIPIWCLGNPGFPDGSQVAESIKKSMTSDKYGPAYFNSRQSNSAPEIWNPIDVAVTKIFENSQYRTSENVSLTVQALFAALTQYFGDMNNLKKIFIDAVNGNNQYLNSRLHKLNSRKVNSTNLQIESTKNSCHVDFTPLIIKISGVDYKAEGAVSVYYQSSANALRTAQLSLSWAPSSKLQRMLKSKGVTDFRWCETQLFIPGYWGEGVKFNEEANQVFIDTLTNGVLTFDTLEDFRKGKCNELSKYYFDKSTQKLTLKSVNSRKHNSRYINAKHEFTGEGELTKDEESEIIEVFTELFDPSNPLDSYIKVINYFIKNWGINKPSAPLGKFKTIEEYADWTAEHRGTYPDLVGNIENFIVSDDNLVDYIEELPSEYNSRKCNSSSEFWIVSHPDKPTDESDVVWVGPYDSFEEAQNRLDESGLKSSYPETEDTYGTNISVMNSGELLKFAKKHMYPGATLANQAWDYYEFVRVNKDTYEYNSRKSNSREPKFKVYYTLKGESVINSFMNESDFEFWYHDMRSRYKDDFRVDSVYKQNTLGEYDEYFDY